MRRAVNRKSWRRLFLNMAAISLAFALAVAAANGSLFNRTFISHEKRVLRACADKAAALDLTDKEAALDALREMEDGQSLQFNLYEQGVLVYSTISQSIRPRPGLSGFDLLIPVGGDMAVTRTDEEEDRFGGVYSTQVVQNGAEYIVYSRDYDGRQVDVMIRTGIIKSSASFATQFLLIVVLIGLIAVMIANVWFSLRFTRPITEMNGIAQQMARLDFSRKAPDNGDDEIAELASSLNTLSDSLASALQELQEKNARLEGEIETQRRLDEMRTGFVANVSHELKTPLAILQGYAEGLETGVADDPEKREKYCRVIREETDRMHKLVLRLLELSRYESGAAARQEPFDLAASVVNIVDLLSEKIAKSGAELELALPDRLPTVGDPLMLEQAVQNYLSNAVSHVNAGGVIRVYTEAYQDGSRLCVYNSGSHVAEEDLENVWQSFYRADKSHSRSEDRFGLGLSIVKAVMVSHGADFGVFNTGDGVVFWLEIPKAEA